jgi:ribonuclease P protein component
VLPASARVRSRSEHRLVAARGRRARRGPIVVHLVSPGTSGEPARAGVIVGKRVGPAVRRNLVKRRLREQLRPRLGDLPDGALLVVRALPGAADAGFDRLGSALDAALRALGARTDSRASGAGTPSRAETRSDAESRSCADTVLSDVDTRAGTAAHRAVTGSRDTS